ncbi:MAG: 30S ribosomal protein S1 [Rhodothermales bacterium]|nr:30S ribosomal protein S1 [Rhodothermales bacterium]
MADAVAEAPAEDEADALPEPVGYTGELTGPVVKLEDLERSQAEHDVADKDKYAQLMSLVEATLTNVSEHELVTGRVVSIGEKDIVIDIGFKSDGIIAKNEFTEEVTTGDEVEVYLERIEDYHGQLVLSKLKADTFKRWRRIEKAFESEEVLEGTIVRRIKGGMIVELFDGVEAFLPGSQIDVRPVRDFDAYLEKRMEFKIVKLNPANENIVVSHKALIEKDLESQRAKILGTMEPGQILEGIVKNITDFGVFIDLGGVDGLLHITDLSWGRVSHPSELVGLDEKLNIVVLDYDKERQRISLGLKQLQPHPWDNIGERYTEDDTVEGKVVSITDYGAFVELEKGIEGLVHISEMSWTEHIKHPSQMVSLGQMVNVKILNIDNEGKKISLGMKQLEPDPWANIAERYPPGTVLNGSVRNITSFGVFVEIEPGIDGLVHISDLSWTKKVRHPSEIVKKGQDLDVVVLNIDAGDRRISLGHKQVETNPWNQFAEVYAEGSTTDATVVRIEDKGIIVRLPLDVEAYLPGSETKSGAEAFRTSYSEGDPLEGLMIVKCDPSQKEIIVSEVATEQEARRTVRSQERRQERKEKDSERQSVKAYQKRAASTSGPTTLGELSGLDALKKKMEAAEEKADEEAEKTSTAAEPVTAKEVAADDSATPATPDVDTSDTAGDLAEVEAKDSGAAIDTDTAVVDPPTEDVAKEEAKPKAKRKSAAKKKE